MRGVRSCAVLEPRAPRQVGIAEREEVAVEDGVALVVTQRTAARIDHDAACRLEHALAGGGIPFAGRTEARIGVHPAFGEPAELQRGAEPDRLDLTHPRQKSL